MIRMPQAISGLPARMLLQVHDELLFEVEAGAEAALIAAARATMTSTTELKNSIQMKLEQTGEYDR